MRVFALCSLLLMAFVAYFAVAGAVDIPEASDRMLCACPRNMDPVCGSDAQTYNNRCLFECAAKKMARLGKSLKLAHSGGC